MNMQQALIDWGSTWRRKHAVAFGGVTVSLALAVGLSLVISPQSGPSLAAKPLLNPKALEPNAADLAAEVKEDLLAATRGEMAATVVAGEEAKLINASMPVSQAPIEPARPFHIATAAEIDQARALQCLAQAIYYEAAFEPVEGRRAVAQVILNRMRHPAFPKSVCGVVYDGSHARGCQFSFTCDGSLRRTPSAAAWSQSLKLAQEALSGAVASSVGHATHYHANYVAPYWAPKLHKLTQIGAHIFYRWPGGWGLRRAFVGNHAGAEPGIRVPPAVEPVIAEAPEVPVAIGVVEPRAANDVGGRLDVSKGWTLSIPAPSETRGSLSQMLSTQQGEGALPAETAKEAPGIGS
jgi:spore germination cell wall hydrolase CwlJ-like protein